MACLFIFSGACFHAVAQDTLKTSTIQPFGVQQVPATFQEGVKNGPPDTSNKQSQTPEHKAAVEKNDKPDGKKMEDANHNQRQGEADAKVYTHASYGGKMFVLGRNLVAATCNASGSEIDTSNQELLETNSKFLVVKAANQGYVVTILDNKNKVKDKNKFYFIPANDFYNYIK